MSKFWVVWNPEGRNPMRRHQREGSATNEAQRLAADSPGKDFYVMEAVSVSRHNSVITIRLDDGSSDEHLPF